MPKQPRTNKFVAAILDIGYELIPNARSYYREFRPGTKVKGFLSREPTSGPGPTAEHRILVGPRAIRYTMGTVAQSRPVPTHIVERVLDSVLSVSSSGYDSVSCSRPLEGFDDAT